MSRIGILGGSFNPPHKAHIKLAVAAYEQYGLDKVLFIPNHHPPHKSEEEFVSDEHRTRMVKKMISSDKYKNFEFSDIELVKDELSYTYKTLEELKKIYPKDQLYFIMGADSLEYFSTWKNPKRIAEIVTILVAPRGEIDRKSIKKLIKKTKKEIGGKYHYLRFDKKYAEISSTDIRDAIISGEASKQIPKKVLLYIRLHGLYGCEPLIFENINQDELKKALKATLDNKRYVHTLGVAETAKELGKIYGEQSGDAKLEEKAYMAGLLHDCAKYYTHDEQLALCDEYSIELTQTERENPALIHGKLGAYLAKHRYGICNEEILEAIRVHTVGKPGMNLLDEIVYVSDYIEPGRKIKGAVYELDDLRELARADVDETVFRILVNTMSYLSDSYKKIDEMSFDTLKYYEKRRKQ